MTDAPPEKQVVSKSRQRTHAPRREWLLGLAGVVLGASVASAVPFITLFASRLERRQLRAEEQTISSWITALDYVTWCDRYFESEGIFGGALGHEGTPESAATFALAECEKAKGARAIVFPLDEVQKSWQRFAQTSEVLIRRHLTSTFPDAYKHVLCSDELPSDLTIELRDAVASVAHEDERRRKDHNVHVLRFPGWQFEDAYRHERQRVFEVVQASIGATRPRLAPTDHTQQSEPN